jgi:Glycosyl hydrolase family 26
MRFTARLAAPLAALSLAAALAAPAGATAVAPARSLIPASGAYLGAFANEPGGMPALEAKVGRKLALDRTYVPWTFTGWAKRIAPDAAAGRIPVLAWTAAPTTNAAAIAAGRQDGVIRAAATAMRNTKVQIMLVMWYEFDQQPGHKRYIGTPAQVIAAWRHTVTLFRAVGALNVHFVWTPMAFDFAGKRSKVNAAAFYPGDDYVHWIGADAYNLPGAPFRTPAELLDDAVAFAKAHNKPFLVGETASLRSNAGTPAWITSFAAWAAAHSNVRGITFFDSVSPKGYDFRLEPSSSVLAAYRALGQRSNMRAMP